MPKRPPSSRKPSSSDRSPDGARAEGLALVVIGILHGYRAVSRAVLPPVCRFVPSCSSFAIEALERHGLVRGGALAVRRVARCHPWNGGGYDPVPPGRG